MLTKEQARKKIQDRIDSFDLPAQKELELIILDDCTIEKEWGWIFFYSSKKWVETNDVQYAIAGNAPYIVNRFDGSIHETGTARSIEYYIDIYKGNYPDNKYIVISGWKDGFIKIQCTKTVREFMGYGLKESKDVTDRVLEGEVVSLEPEKRIEEFNEALAQLGAICKIEKIREPVSAHNSGGCAPSA